MILRHLIGRASQATNLLGSAPREAFHSDRRLTLALSHLVVLVGAAASDVPEAVRSEITGVPWHLLTGMGEHAIHDYDTLNLDAVYDVVTQSFPLAIRQVGEYLAAL
jgi:uncharacterized protein with HEPN domain